MIYLCVGLAILAVVFGYFAFKMRFNHKMISKMSEDDLKANTAILAENLKEPKPYGSAPQISVNIKKIKKVYRLISNKIKNDQEIYLYEKLIYENYHNILSHYNSQNYKYFAILPHNYGTVRIILLAEYILSNTHYLANKQNIMAIVNKFNEYTPLSTAEITAIPNALLYCLVGKVAEIAHKSKMLNYYERVARESKFAKEIASNYDYLYFRSKYGKLEDDKKKMDNYSGNLDNIEYIFTEKLSNDFEVMSNIVASLNFVKKELDGVYLLSINHTNILLERDVLYKSMDTKSKNDYLNIIQDVSNKFKIEEQVVVQKLFDLQEATGEHFGKYLFEEKQTLKHYINNDIILTDKKQTKIKEIYFILAVWGITLLLTGLFGFLTSSNLGVMIATIIVSPFFLLPLVNNIAINLLSFTLKQKATPKLELSELPDHAKTMVIIPIFIGGEEDIDRACNKIKEIQMSNKGKNIDFSLLVDYKKCTTEVDTRDEELNKRFFNKLSSYSDINVFVRKRVKQGKYYSGFERKRGAILDLCEMFVTGSKEKFAYIMNKNVQKPTFIATLDDDNSLLPNTILNAVSRMLHPLNLQYDLMTLKTRYDLSSMTTLYAKRYYFDCGYSRYLPTNSFYYNFFGKGIYCGKGIFRLEPYYTKLQNVFPNNRILSHDIIEGSVLKTGELLETAFENAPNSIPSELARHNRWFKGDLLLGGFVKNKIRNANNEVKKHEKPPIYKHIIILNIMNGFAKFGLLVSLFASIITGSILFLIPFLIGFFTDYFVCLLRTIDGTRHNIRSIFVLKNVFNILLEIVLAFFTLPIIAVNNLLVAIDTIICRILPNVDRLNWTTFSQTQTKTGINNHCRFVLPACLVMLALSIIFVGNVFIVGYAAISIAVAFCLYVTSIKQEENQVVTEGEREFLLEVAKRTYKYFDEQDANELVTDNIQIRPFGGKSKYTSPTNLGFAILSEICAYELKLITKSEAESKLVAKLQVLLDLEKYEGNFYNWYNVEEKIPAYPFYISSVDNGNLLACLVVAKQFILKNSIYGIDLVTKLIEQINLEALLDKNKNLFHIGYNTQTKQFDNYYDLLASEARILSYLYAALYQNSKPWDNLSRDCVGYGGNTLVSWSGTMFEYLLPNIFIRAPKNSLLYQTESNVVKLAIKKKCNNMWGVSESGYYKFDDNLRYQYYSFGLRELAIRNTQNKCVIAPYGTALALRIDAKEAVKNLITIKKECGLGEYGFYEAIDITSRKHIIYQYMSHHQGMVLASITNCLCDNNISGYFESDAKISAAKVLLSEKKIQEKSFKKPKEDFVYSKFELSNYNSSDNSAIYVLTNGKWTGYFNAFGDNLSNIYDTNICKYHHTFEDFGIKCSIFNSKTQQEIEYHTKTNGDNNFEFIADCEKVVYHNKNADISQEIYIPNCLNGEVRKFEVNCHNFEDIYARGYGEVALLNENDYIAHPAFKDMFLSSQKFDDNTVIFKRKADKMKYVAIRIIGLDKITFETNKSNCYDIITGKVKYNDVEFDNSFGDVVYPCICYNGHKNCSKLDKFEYYQLTIYAESYSELTNKLSHLTDKKAIYNLIYSAKLPTLSAIRKIFGGNSGYEFLTKLAFKLKYGSYSNESLMCKLDNKYKQKLNSLSLDIKENIIYLNTQDSNLFKLLLKSLRVLKPLCGEFTVVCKGEYTSLFRQIRECYFDIKVMFTQDESCITAIKNVAFLVLNSEIILNSPYQKAIDVDDMQSIGVDIPQFDLQNNYGGFEGKNFVLTTTTQKPFSNVICGKYGGFVAANNGEGFTFFGNSQNDKFTEWRGEAHSKIASERVVIFEGGKGWQINKWKQGGFVKYGQGFIDYVMSNGGIYSNCSESILDDGQGKVICVTLKNLCEYSKTIKLDLALKIALGANRECKNILIETNQNITAIKNLRNEKCAYVKIVENDLYSYIDGNFIVHNQINFDLQGTESRQIFIVMSNNAELIAEYSLQNIPHKINQTLEKFEKLNNIAIKTDNAELDKLFNNWLMYSVYSSRLCGKCGYYQVGGANGFRDQLQDCLAYMYSDSEFVRNHILMCAEKQFIEGDVLHWWHGYAEGVRTNISDDKLFLPLVVAEYINFTSDKSILGEKVSYLKSEEIPEGWHDLYKAFEKSDIQEDLYSHCIRAIKNSLKFGKNGLMLIGDGDWNDALNNIGNKTDGESVWLTMFCLYVLKKFDKYFKAKEKTYFDKIIPQLESGIENAWNGNWYNRAVTKDGEWLGNENCTSCKIDLISQAFAAICESCDDKKVKQALTFAETLENQDKMIVKLLSPPFNDKKNYGYISNYPEGVRENGGQYTHSVAWYIKALAMHNMPKAISILDMTNPLNLSNKSKDYKNEPFVMSADVYLNGEGGWSWYTGSNAWYYKVILNDILGINIEDNKIIIKPCGVGSIKNYSVTLGFKNCKATINLLQTGKKKLEVNEQKIQLTNNKFIVELSNKINEYRINIEY